MKKYLCLLLILVFCCPLTSSIGIAKETQVKLSNLETNEMQETKQEYLAFLNNLAQFPVSFIYDDVFFKGFHPAYFTEKQRIRTNERNGEVTTIILQRENLQVKIVSAFYAEYNAYDYTVYFSNVGKENTGVIRNLLACDLQFFGTNPVLKGIMGDYDYRYEPYEKDLTKNNVNFTSTRGRPTHTHFPYFNLETDNGGAMIAIGWAGTWQADFEYNSELQTTAINATGTVGLNTYLKPNETIRTPLMAFVRYYKRNEDVATNAWRKWMIDCNMPKENALSDEVVQPHTMFMLAFDTGKPNSDGCISEDSTTWKKSLDALYAHDIDVDIVHYDAGWYSDPYGNTVPTDWWGTVGSWTLDKEKWPKDTYQQRIEYQQENGSKMLMWFEPERVTHLNGMVANYGYNRKWVLSDHGNNNCYLNNLGIKECLEWTLNKIITAMDTYNVDLYREDFNIDPYPYWDVGDGYQGINRKGITENLYIQGHYALWDGIINYCAENGKFTFLDSCASGGGRNDLESMRRAVPLLRSDADRSTTTLRLSFNTRFNKWIPYGGGHAKDTAGEMAQGTNVDLYTMRCTYNLDMFFKLAWSINKDLNWSVIEQSLKEWKKIAPYFYCDYYQLTKDNGITEDNNWTAYEYFDKNTDSGVIQLFRQDNCDNKYLTVCVKGLNPNAYYSVTDVDGVNSIAKVKGAMLMKGLTVFAENPRTAIVLYVTPYN